MWCVRGQWECGLETRMGYETKEYGFKDTRWSHGWRQKFLHFLGDSWIGYTR